MTKKRTGKWTPWKRAIVWLYFDYYNRPPCAEWRRIIRAAENPVELVVSALTDAAIPYGWIVNDLDSPVGALDRLHNFITDPDSIVRLAASRGWDGRLPK